MLRSWRATSHSLSHLWDWTSGGTQLVSINKVLCLKHSWQNCIWLCGWHSSNQPSTLFWQHSYLFTMLQIYNKPNSFINTLYLYSEYCSSWWNIGTEDIKCQRGGTYIYLLVSTLDIAILITLSVHLQTN